MNRSKGSRASFQYNHDNFNSNNDTSSKSLLIDFNKFPFENDIYGYCELNAEFQFIKFPDFEKNLINKFQLPYFNHTQPQIPSTKEITAQYGPTQPLIKSLLQTYESQGIIGVCKELSSDTSIVNTYRDTQVPPIIKSISKFIVGFIDFVNAPINPLIYAYNEDRIRSVSNLKVESWKNMIKVFKWHPIQNKFALAFKNDLIQIYGHNSATQNATLKHQKQIDVTCLAWKPYHPSILAVGCANCIIIWDIDAIPVSIKPSSTCSYTLSHLYHNDIIDLQWDSKTDYLYSFATKDNQIMIWDTTLKQCTPIKRIGNYGFSFGKFCPNSLKLFTSDLLTTFRIWNTSNFSFEKWSDLKSRVITASWSPDGKILLFACANSSLLYSIYFHDHNKQETRIECDLSEVLVDNFNLPNEYSRKYCFGGEISDICWDQNGERLAVTFKKYDNDFSLNVVATFLTKNYLQFQLIPCGVIRDQDNNWPSIIQFKPNFDYGSLLTIVWSNGRIQYVPFCYANPDDKYGHTIPSNIGHLAM